MFPATSQPSPGDFIETYRELGREADSIISIHISSALSGTVESALTAVKDPDLGAEVDVVDSRSVTLGCGQMVIRAAEMAREGADREAILRELERMIVTTRIVFVVDTLEYLRRGGRIGGAQAFLGSLLKVKPVLHVLNGRIEPLDRPRSTKRALARLVRYIEDGAGGEELEFCAVLHAANEAGAREVREMVASRFEVGRWHGGQIGAVVGTHAGPGVVGASFPARIG